VPQEEIRQSDSEKEVTERSRDKTVKSGHNPEPLLQSLSDIIAGNTAFQKF